MALPAPGSPPLIYRLPSPGCWPRVGIGTGLFWAGLSLWAFFAAADKPMADRLFLLIGGTAMGLGFIVPSWMLGRTHVRDQWAIAMDAEGIWPAELDRRAGLIPWGSIETVRYDPVNGVLVLFGPERKTLMLIRKRLENYLEARVNVGVATGKKIGEGSMGKMTPLEAIPVHRRRRLPLGLIRRSEWGDDPRFGS